VGGRGRGRGRGPRGTLFSTASTRRQQTSTSTAPLSDREPSIWDLLRSGQELGHGEPPDSWAADRSKTEHRGVNTGRVVAGLHN